MRFFLFLILSMAVAAPLYVRADVGSPQPLQNFSTIKAYSASQLKPWQALKSRQRAAHYDPSLARGSQSYQAWQIYLNSLRYEPKLRQMMAVNNWFGQFPYRLDSQVYQTHDYWATPQEYFAYGGDCEDIAIAKYESLKKLGFSPDDMKVAIVYDADTYRDHAFLIVKHEGADYVLDNREKMTVVRYLKHRYKPHFMFNDEKVWTFGSPLAVSYVR